MKNPIRQCRQ